MGNDESNIYGYGKTKKEAIDNLILAIKFHKDYHEIKLEKSKLQPDQELLIITKDGFF